MFCLSNGTSFLSPPPAVRVDINILVNASCSHTGVHKTFNYIISVIMYRLYSYKYYAVHMS